MRLTETNPDGYHIMHLTDFRGFVSNLAVATTILQFLSGILVCKQYVQNKTTAETSPLPFLCGLLSAGLWLLYGLTKNDDKIIFVNIVGVILMVLYVIVFYKYTFKKSSFLKQACACAASFIIAFGYASIEEDNEMLLNRLGLSACSLTVLTIAAPMSKLFYVIKYKNTECLPFPMILMSFFVSTLWLLYGIIENDVYLMLPNFLGAVLAVSQLSLFVIYPRRPHSPSLAISIPA